MFLFDPYIVETRPGGSRVNPFSPPADFNGGDNEYLALMRTRYKDPNYNNTFVKLVKTFKQDRSRMVVNGPYGALALSVLSSILGSK